MEIPKTAKMKNAEKKTDILTRTVSTGVFTNSVFFIFCVSFNFALFAENTIKIGVSAKKTKNKKKQNSKVKNWSKLKLKTGPSMLRNIIVLTLKGQTLDQLLTLQHHAWKISGSMLLCQSVPVVCLWSCRWADACTWIARKVWHGLSCSLNLPASRTMPRAIHTQMLLEDSSCPSWLRPSLAIGQTSGSEESSRPRVSS